MNKAFLGIDTSNYRTSVAIVDECGKILFNHRELLEVPEGKRGLRQSEAFFQHVQRLPDVIKRAMEYRESIAGISVSVSPRPREGSYMPCFTAGTACAKEIASALNVPLTETSHQEGHIEAVRFFSELKDEDDLVFFHFSGGTTEAVYKDEIIGGTKDISYGQVLDRVGVKLGFAFPAGEELDRISLETSEWSNVLTPIKVKDCWLNLSGIETQAMRAIDSGTSADNELIREVMDKLCDSILTMTFQIYEKYKVKNFIFAGGVSSSEFIRNRISEELPADIKYVFGAPELSGDNAVGVALIASKNSKG